MSNNDNYWELHTFSSSTCFNVDSFIVEVGIRDGTINGCETCDSSLGDYNRTVV